MTTWKFNDRDLAHEAALHRETLDILDQEHRGINQKRSAKTEAIEALRGEEAAQKKHLKDLYNAAGWVEEEIQDLESFIVEARDAEEKIAVQEKRISQREKDKSIIEQKQAERVKILGQAEETKDLIRDTQNRIKTLEIDLEALDIAHESIFEAVKNIEAEILALEKEQMSAGGYI